MPAVSPLEWLGLKRAASLQILFLLGLVLASGVSVVYLTHRDRVLFTELQALREQENEIEVQWGQLLIEQSTLGLGGRVEQKATELLGMQIPQIDDIVMVVNGQAEEQ
ncbi:MAG: cell division protein FtsL [Gammaproteobacteria bacterium]|nr:cell division protein FtsL [Gammaproteobacteria bacterium]